MAERPLWDWAVHFPYDLLIAPGLYPTRRGGARGRHPEYRPQPVGHLAGRQPGPPGRPDQRPRRSCKARRLPVLVLWGEGDGIIPRASFEALCAAVGSAGKVVPGRHAWLLADPDGFGEVMANSVTEAQAARVARNAGSPRRRATSAATQPARPPLTPRR